MSDAKMTVRTVAPAPTRRPNNDYVREYLDSAIRIAHNATLDLTFAGFADVSTFAQTLRETNPELFDDSQMTGIANGLRIEVENNYSRYIETKARDQYSHSLREKVKKFITPAIAVLQNILDHLQSWENALKEEHGLIGEEVNNAGKLTAFIRDSRREHIQSEKNAVRTAFFVIREWQEIIEESLAIYFPPQPAPAEPQPTEPGNAVKLQWKGEKTDLVEVVYALYKSGRITNTSTGQDVTKKLLAKELGELFGVDMSDMETPMKGRKNSHKAHYDGKTFTRHLAQLVDNFIKIT